MQNDTNLNNLVTFEGVGKSFHKGRDVALRSASFTVAEGEFLCIVGPSGCGKSTVLRIIATLEQPTAGIVSKPDSVAMVFQSSALFPWLTVFENVALGLRAKHFAEEHVKRETLHFIEMMKLGDYAQKYPRELSGGQRQRVGIARALAVKPKVLLLDEPFSALDPKTTHELHADLVALWHQMKVTIVMVSHSIEEAVSVASRILLMKEGTVKHSYSISLSYPRREQATDFMANLEEIRKDFFR